MKKNIDIKINMEQFDISDLGFLPSKCVNRLPKSFEFLNEIVENLPETVSGNQFRKYFDSLPEYKVNLHYITDLDDSECKYMYSVLCMIMNRYIWCTGVKDAQNYSNIPQIIGIPLYQVSQRLGISLSLTHSAVNLWNWIIKTKEFNLDNIEVINTMTGNESESWFYKVMIAIEGNGGKMLKEILEMNEVSDIEKPASFTLSLLNLSNNINVSTKIIKRMYEKCDTNFFFNNLRIYLSGSDNDNLPKGIQIDLSSIGKDMLCVKYKGGSAAQSSLIQVYDKLLGIKHNKSKDFLIEMHNYMPNAHKQYLNAIKPIDSYVLHAQDRELTDAYNKCIFSLENFRKSHLSLVKHYIMRHIKPKINQDNNAHGTKGSGGTDPINFLSEIINNTKSSNVLIRNNNSTMLFWLLLLLLGVIVFKLIM